MKLIFFITLWFSFTVQALAPSDRLIMLLEKIQTLKASFDQQIITQGEAIQKSHGEMVIKRPHQFYWKSNSPEIIVVADGKFLWNYDIELAQVTKQALLPTLTHSPAALLAGNIAKLSQQFKISDSKQCSKKIDECFLLRPLQKDTGFSEIIMGFAKGELSEFIMYDLLDQKIITQFSRVKLNEAINPRLFVFTVPANADVIQVLPH